VLNGKKFELLKKASSLGCPSSPCIVYTKKFRGGETEDDRDQKIEPVWGKNRPVKETIVFLDGKRGITDGEYFENTKNAVVKR